MKNDFLDLTIVIFTYNRHKFLQRTLEYYTNFNLKILVVDGSDKNFNNIILNRSNIKYYHIKKDYYSRYSFATKKITTKYIIIANDDEFLIINSLKKCINFLGEYDFVYHNMKQVQGIKEKNLRVRSISEPYFEDLIVNGNAIMTSSVVTKKEVLFKPS